jgi:hypothetical protein
MLKYSGCHFVVVVGCGGVVGVVVVIMILLVWCDVGIEYRYSCQAMTGAETLQMAEIMEVRLGQ